MMQISEQSVQGLLAFLPILYNTALNFTFPVTIQEPNIVGVDSFLTTLSFFMGKVGNAMGVDSEENIARKFQTFIDRGLIPYPNDPAVKIVRDSFNGVPVYVHTPTAPCYEPRPALVFLHGGGWVYRTPYKYIHQTAYLSKMLGAVVVSVDYRLAPEYPFPAGLDDCIKVTTYLMENANNYYVNPQRIGVAGDSAGGNLAAAITLVFRDNNLPPIKTQVLLYPVLQMLDFKTPSYLANNKFPLVPTTDYVLRLILSYLNLNQSFAEAMSNNRHICGDLKKIRYDSYVKLEAIPKKYLQSYSRTESGCDPIVAKGVKNAILNPYISPLVAKSLSNLPPALIINEEFDVLRDDGLMYAYRLKRAGVDVENHIIEGGVHAGIDFLGKIKTGTQQLELVVRYLKKHL